MRFLFSKVKYFYEKIDLILPKEKGPKEPFILALMIKILLMI